MFVTITFVLIVSSSAVVATQTSDGFSYPVGPRVPPRIPYSVTEERDGDGWYNAQDFGDFNSKLAQPGLHPGEDWNSESVACGSPGACDVGAPVYAVANGEVVGSKPVSSSKGEPVGYVLVLRHILPGGQNIYSVYLHINVVGGLHGEIRRDQQIGTIADTRPTFSPYLHFELRSEAVNLNNLYEND
jgi:murein DD-endopeptidase MepM/ murein hydrolase activator NlpD